MADPIAQALMHQLGLHAQRFGQQAQRDELVLIGIQTPGPRQLFIAEPGSARILQADPACLSARWTAAGAAVAAQWNGSDGGVIFERFMSRQ